MKSGGISPSAAGLEIRVGKIARENSRTKAARLLLEGRVMVLRVDSAGCLADVRGDSGQIRRVVFDSQGDDWSCPCPARGKCSHVLAVAMVVVVRGPER